MARTTIDTWNPEFLLLSPIFDSIQEVAQPFTQLKQWPTLQQFADEFSKRGIQSYNGSPVHPVAQGEAPEKFEDHYESRIYLKGELQTRLDNWHDLFNATAWLQFPKTKSALNALHFENSKTREAGTNRSPLENAITLFDECGAIIVADDEKLLEMIRNHQWKEIFLDNKEAWQKHIQCFVFGHAMHEKALTLYLGMTTHCILLKKEDDFFQQDYPAQLEKLDTETANIWIDKKINKTKDLQPVPILGIPAWYKQQTEDFYANKDYFRSLRNKPD
ncbi:MAG: DUF3025 domain-containing protein [Gammaproteobacteria bacterium]|nr:DUF3025 domain-containing protein [Gammaproteobacteria bacterium]